MTTSTIADVQRRHDQTRIRIATCWASIQALDQNYVAKRDLKVLHTNLRLTWAQMDNEMIECRKRNGETWQYSELAETMEKYLKIIEKEVFWQNLH